MSRRVGASTVSPETPGHATSEQLGGTARNARALLKPREVADLCRCSVKTVMRAVLAGELEASQLGRRGTWVVRPEAVDEWLYRRSNRARPTRSAAHVRRVEAEPAQQSPKRRRARQVGGDGRLAA